MTRDDKMNMLFFIRDTIPELIKMWEGENNENLTASGIPKCFGQIEERDEEGEVKKIGLNMEDPFCVGGGEKDRKPCILLEACGKWLAVYNSPEAKTMEEGSESVPVPEPEVKAEEPVPEPPAEATEPKVDDKKPKKEKKEKKKSKVKKKKAAKKKVGTIKETIIAMLQEGATQRELNNFVEELGKGKASLTATLSELRKLGKLKEDKKTGKLTIKGSVGSSKKLPRGYIKSTILEMLGKGTTRDELNEFIKKLGKGNLQLNKTLSELRKDKKLIEKNGSMKLKK